MSVPWYQRWLMSGTDWAWSLKTGYTTPFLVEIVESYGLGNAFKLLGAMTSSTNRLADAFNPTAAQLVLGIAGTWNGCRFCGAGHIYAANVLYFKETGELMPVDERETFELQMLPFEELVKTMTERFANANTELAQQLTPIVKRTFEIELGAQPDDSDGDKAIVSAIETWNQLNECSVETVYDFEYDIVPALNEIYKDKKLLARYQAARGRG